MSNIQLFTVTQFVAYLNDTFKAIWDPNLVAIEGEVSEFKISQGQWVNFLLKDEDSTVSAFLTAWKLPFMLQDGMKVRVYGNPRIYQKFGKFSLNVERVELVGEGGLRKALEATRQRLMAEGLFAMERKRSLMRFPARIALIASKESAAYGDFIRIVEERWKGLEIDAYHVQVQGDAAPQQICQAIERANASDRDYDVLVLTRGGGAFEELMAFNDERVVRALFASRIPTLVGIGHERDVTLAEEVADVRGSTPTDCARRLVPDREDVLYELATLQETIDSRMQEVITQKQERIVRTVDAVDRWFGRLRERHGMQAMRFEHGFTTWHRNLVERVTSIERLCQSFNPTLVLKRGYAIVRDGKGKPMVSVKQLLPREEVTVQLQDGAVPAMIINTNQPRLL